MSDLARSLIDLFSMANSNYQNKDLSFAYLVHDAIITGADSTKRLVGLEDRKTRRTRG